VYTFLHALHPPALGGVSAATVAAQTPEGLAAHTFDEAVPKLLLAIQEDPSLPDPYRTLAACYTHMGRFEDAREIVNRLRTITPLVVPTDRVLARYDLTRARTVKGKKSTASENTGLARATAKVSAKEGTLSDLETAERVVARVGKTPPIRRSRSAVAAEAKASPATRGRGRPPKAATLKPARREPSAPSLGERVLGLAAGKTRQEIYAACPTDRPNHVGIVVQRHIRAGRIQERDGKLYMQHRPQQSRHTRRPDSVS
jgi:Tetratricopeptide repeat/AT hook motif